MTGKSWHRITVAIAVGIATAFTITSALQAAPRQAVPSQSRLLPQAKKGTAALAALGSEKTAEAAKRSGMSTEMMRSILKSDASAWIDTSGQLYYQESTVRAESNQPSTLLPAMSQPDTFALHSLAGAPTTIYLDFDGAYVSGTAWNDSARLPADSYPGFDTNGDATTFSATELAQIRTIWAQVAEDYAPWQVDVTTAAPATLTNASTIVFTSGTKASSVLCSGGCGGIAYVSSFGNPRYAPAFVFTTFTRANSGNVTYTAESASHEAGHTLGLQHDGVTNVSEYYGGSNGWSTIMGAPGYPISQWSRGSYPGANNTQDDLAIIGRTLPPRLDEAGSTVATATSATSGVITTSSDIDVVAVGQCQGRLVVSAATPGTSLPNLDIALSVLNSSGATMGSADPPSSGAAQASQSSGMGASVTVSDAPSDTYYARIDGTGRGTWDDGYDDYGSIGTWSVTATCNAAPTVSAIFGDVGTSASIGSAPIAAAGAPGRPGITRVSSGNRGGAVTAAVRWTAPRAHGSPIRRYTVFATRIVEGRSVQTVAMKVGANARSLQARLPRRGIWRFAVQATNGVGSSSRSAPSKGVTAR